MPLSSDRRNLLIVLVLTALMVLPFLGKAVHMDDPLFLAAARQIQAHPLDPYGVQLNWYGRDMPLSEITKNPPLTSYYLALAATLFGWSEPALHAAMALPALALAAGIYLLAAACCRRPVLAALLAIFTPAFLISSTTLMCDVMMLACWVFAVWLWLRGLDRSSHGLLAAAMMLAAAAALTKYFAISLLPLLIIVGWIRRPALKGWWLHSAIPMAVLIGYQLATRALYGRGLLADAFAYSPEPGPSWAGWVLFRILAAPAFTGACIASLLFLAPWLWPRRGVMGAAIATVATAVVVASLESIGTFRLPADAVTRWWFAVQLAIWCVAGAGMLILAVRDWQVTRETNALLLGLWLIGTFAFAGFVNWTVNGRTVLPMIVPAAILAVRRLDRARDSRSALTPRALTLPVAGAAVLALATAWADMSLANAVRLGATQAHPSAGAGSRPAWFQGHWGFQYYMESLGAKPIDVTKPIQRGDLIVTPTTNTNVFQLPSELMTIRGIIEVPLSGWVVTMAPSLGASFYADMPLPFAIGGPPAERITIREFTGG
jgi:4-amino-4-deoxy-L-arabinose transferase-like glycosyltransferase